MRDVVLFDLDGTLVDSAQGIAVALNGLRAGLDLPPLPIDMVRPLVALGVERLVGEALGNGHASAAEVAAFRGNLALLPADPAMLYPGVEAMLHALRGAGARLAIVTNKPERLSRSLLEQLGLAQLFDAIIGGDSAALPKPAPDPILLALDRLGANANHACFVGDSAIDATAAAACSLPFYLFTSGYGASDPYPHAIAGRFPAHDRLPPLLIGRADAPATLEKP